MVDSSFWEIEKTCESWTLSKSFWVFFPRPRGDGDDLPLSKAVDSALCLDDFPESIAASEDLGDLRTPRFDLLVFDDAGRPPPPPWRIGFGKQFRKDTDGLDRKMMGRILEVLEELCELPLPLVPRGDTFKPLRGELKGAWRYRIGDSRLVVMPHEANAQIDAVAFGSRGGIYD